MVKPTRGAFLSRITSAVGGQKPSNQLQLSQFIFIGNLSAGIEFLAPTDGNIPSWGSLRNNQTWFTQIDPGIPKRFLYLLPPINHLSIVN